MKVLVSAASRHGSTAMIADCIREELEGLGFIAHVASPELVTDVTSYDAVVLGSAVYAGKWLGSAKKLVDRCEADLRKRPVWLFSSGPVGEPAKPTQPPADALELTERLRAVDHQVFEGRINREQLGVGERFILRIVGAADGDNRQWGAIAAWARGIGDSLLAKAAPARATEPAQPPATGVAAHA